MLTQGDIIRAIKLYKPGCTDKDIVNRALNLYLEVIKLNKTGSTIFVDDFCQGVREFNYCDPGPRAIIQGVCESMGLESFAEQFTFSMSYIYYVKTGVHKITKRFAKELCNRYGFTVDFWMSENGEDQPNWSKINKAEKFSEIKPIPKKKKRKRKRGGKQAKK